MRHWCFRACATNSLIAEISLAVCNLEQIGYESLIPLFPLARMRIERPSSNHDVI